MLYIYRYIIQRVLSINIHVYLYNYLYIFFYRLSAVSHRISSEEILSRGIICLIEHYQYSIYDISLFTRFVPSPQLSYQSYIIYVYCMYLCHAQRILIYINSICVTRCTPAGYTCTSVIWNNSYKFCSIINVGITL